MHGSTFFLSGACCTFRPVACVASDTAEQIHGIFADWTGFITGFLQIAYVCHWQIHADKRQRYETSPRK